MRQFIVSDLHGNGEVYDSIMSYLENISINDVVHLYINGDLIDRGLDSFRMLEDVIERVDGKIIASPLDGRESFEVEENALVSMNFFGFTSRIMGALKNGINDFVKSIISFQKEAEASLVASKPAGILILS